MPKKKNAAARSFADVERTLRHGFAQLSPQFQSGARYLLDHPDEVAVSSMRSLAAHAKVRPATLVRLAQHLGFAGWQELRAPFVDRLRATPVPYGDRAQQVIHARSPDSLMSEVFRAQARNLQFAEARNHEALIAAAKLIERGAQVHVAGFRVCYPLAFAFHYLYRLFRPEVTLVAAAGGTLELNLRAVGARDTVVVISFAPYSREARVVAREARKTGAKVVAITDSPAAPIAQQADTVILFSVDSASFFPSATAGLAVVESLVATLLSRAGESAVQRIKAAEEQLFDLGAYEKPPAHRTHS